MSSFDPNEKPFEYDLWNIEKRTNVFLTTECLYKCIKHSKEEEDIKSLEETSFLKSLKEDYYGEEKHKIKFDHKLIASNILYDPELIVISKNILAVKFKVREHFIAQLCFPIEEPYIAISILTELNVIDDKKLQMFIDESNVEFERFKTRIYPFLKCLSFYTQSEYENHDEIQRHICIKIENQ
jgi:hypothetical protein